MDKSKNDFSITIVFLDFPPLKPHLGKIERICLDRQKILYKMASKKFEKVMPSKYPTLVKSKLAICKSHRNRQLLLYSKFCASHFLSDGRESCKRTLCCFSHLSIMANITAKTIRVHIFLPMAYPSSTVDNT